MSPGTRLFFIGAGVVGFVVCLRGAACAIDVQSEGIRVVNPLRTRDVPWTDIQEFALGPWGILPRNCVIRLFRDGSAQGVWAISARNPNLFTHDSAAEGLVAGLNERLHRQR